MPCRFRHDAGRGHPYVASISFAEFQDGNGITVGRPEANIVVVIRAIVVPVTVEHARIRTVIPVAGSDREKHVNGPPYSACGKPRKLRIQPPIIAPNSLIRIETAVYRRSASPGLRVDLC